MGFETGEKYVGQERRSERQSELSAIHQRLRDGDAMMTEFREGLQANTALTQQTAATVARIDENTAGFIAFSQDLVAGTKFLCRCAKGVQWLAEMIRRYWFVTGGLVAWYAYATNQMGLLDTALKVIKP